MSGAVSNTTRRRLRNTATGALLVLVMAFYSFPIIWMALAALKTPLQISDPTKTLVFTPTLNNFARLAGQNHFGDFIWNSTIVAAAATATALVLGVPAAYAISRYTMHRSNVWILAARVVPGISLLVPWYYFASTLGLVGTYAGLILCHLFVTLPLVVWIMTGFFDGVPTELEEAGLVDGLGPIGVFGRIIMPLSMSGMATAALLSIVFSWNNFLFSLVLSDNDTRTMPVALYNFVSYASIDWGGLMAASTICMAPVIAFAFVAERWLVSGLTAGAIKG